ncbi:MAG: hypothetical protein JXQ23_02080, partial [Clostridia bacterium]|nr:hypothetical protein [Clostridia bacterium]
MKSLDKYIIGIIIVLALIFSAVIVTVALYNNKQAEVPAKTPDPTEETVITAPPEVTKDQTEAPTDSPVVTPTEMPEATPTETPVATPTETPVATPTEPLPEKSPDIEASQDENIKFVKADGSLVYNNYEEPREILY